MDESENEGDEMKQKNWGYVWTTASEDVCEVVEQFYPNLGRDFNMTKCKDDFIRAKKDGTIGKNSKLKIYKVIFEEVDYDRTK